MPDLSGTARHDRGVAWSTKRENLTKAQVNVKLDASIDFGSNPDAPREQMDSPGAGQETFQTVSAAFQEEVATIDKTIEDLTKNMRIDDGGAAEAKQKAEREAELRKFEAEVRKARLAQKAARDPKRKVQLRLEHRRRFDTDSPDKALIPETTVLFQNLLGIEKVKMVDILALRKNCTGLSEGLHSVTDLVDLQVRREKSLRFSSASTLGAGTGSLMMSGSMPSLTLGLTESMMFDDSLLPSQMSWEDRYRRASVQRKCQISEKIVAKLNKMRSPPDRLPQAHDVFDYCALDTRGSWGTTSLGCILKGDSLQNSIVDTTSPAGRALAKQQMTPMSNHDSPGECHNHSHNQYHEMTPQCKGHETVAIESAVAPASDEVLKRVKHLWVCFRGCVRFMTVYFAHMRRLDSSDILRKLVAQEGEWSRIKKAMKRLCNSVVEVQRCVRTFFATRDKRIEVMNGDWKRMEENYLSSFFKLYAFRAMDERGDPEANFSKPKTLMRTETSAVRAKLRMSKEETDRLVESSLDLKSLRIPARVRKGLLNRYYMIELHNHIRMREDMIRTVRHTMEHQKDVVAALALFGHTPSPSEMVAPQLSSLELVMAEFWHFKEETVYELIAIAADHLQHDNPAFKEHPAAKVSVLLDHDFDKFVRPRQTIHSVVKLAIVAELQGRPFSRLELFRESDKLVLTAAGRSKTAAVEAVDRKANVRSPIDRSVNFAIEDGQQRRPDMDELWRGFSPRLQEQREKEASEWMASPQEHDERLDELNPERFNQL